MSRMTVKPWPAAAGAPASAERAAEAPQKVNILLVDDDPRNLFVLETVLQGLGQNVVRAQSGRAALRCLLNDDFAVILMDVRMPDMDGFETAALIRQRRKSQDTPIIFLTAFEKDDLQMFKGYSVGAVDYLHKPIVPEVLRAKVAVFVEIFQKSEQIRQQAERVRQLEQRAHERQLAEVKERWEADRLRAEMHVARQIQQQLFPAASLPLPGFDISGASYPAEATGGDYFDYIPMQDGARAIVIADVSGHGYGPALLMAETRAYLRAFILMHRDVVDILRLLNRALAGDNLDDRFATLMLVRLDPQRRKLAYVSAGHPSGYVLDSTGGVKTTLPSTGLPLAVVPDAEYEAAPEIILEPGEGVFLLTDGITEARAPDDTLLGAAPALEIIHTHWQRPAREIIDQLYLAIRNFRGPTSQHDDMTAVVIKVESVPG
jgi:serine phosphatase RsbU (regulator of sigma subunit)